MPTALLEMAKEDLISHHDSFIQQAFIDLDFIFTIVLGTVLGC